jgi:hypothetical protein
MLTVDFMNALGITAKKIEIKNGNNTIFKADSLKDNPDVLIGGFTVDSTKLSAGTGGSTIALQTSTNNVDAETLYTPAEYVEATGSQFIDTGVVMNYDDDVVEITVEPTVADQNGMFFGVWDAGSSTGNKTAVLYHTEGSYVIRFYVGNGSSTTDISSDILRTDLTKHTYRLEKNNNKYELSVDGDLKGNTEDG